METLEIKAGSTFYMELTPKLNDGAVSDAATLNGYYVVALSNTNKVLMKWDTRDMELVDGKWGVAISRNDTLKLRGQRVVMQVKFVCGNEVLADKWDKEIEIKFSQWAVGNE